MLHSISVAPTEGAAPGEIAVHPWSDTGTLAALGPPAIGGGTHAYRAKYKRVWGPV